VQNLFCCLLGVQNLFCGPLGVQNLFCGLLGVQNLFCGLLGVQNLFCGRIGMHVILRFDFLDITVRHEIGKRYISNMYANAIRVHSQKKAHYQSHHRKINFALQE